MKAVVFHKPGDVSVDEVLDPEIQNSTDAIIRVTSTAICGSDIHIYNGLIPQPRETILGHEFMGIVEETGSAVRNIKRGDRVIIPFPVSCGECFYCDHELQTYCEHAIPTDESEAGSRHNKGAAVFGYADVNGGYEGGQAQFVRVPFADVGPRIVPDELSDDQLLFLTDTFPAGYAAADRCSLKGGEVVVVFGCGPVGLMAQKAAWIKGAGRVIALDIQDYRMEMARSRCGSDTINANREDAIERILDMTDGRGADVVIDAVGMEAERETWNKPGQVVETENGSMKALAMCFDAVRCGGVVSVVGSYTSTYNEFPLQQIFEKGITLKMGLVPAHQYIDELMKYVEEEQIVLEDIITHHLPLEEAPRGYEIFKEKKENCMKVVLKPFADKV